MAAIGNKNAQGNKGGGRKVIYNKRFARLARTLYESGLTDKEVAVEFDVSLRTINKWKKQHPEFYAHLKDGKEKPNENVKQSLYKKSLGGIKTIERRVTTDPKGGETVTIIEKESLPDTASIMFWLKNRMPDEWKDKREAEENSTADLAEAFAKLSSVLPT